MADIASDVHWRLSGAATVDTSQPDPLLSLGDRASSDKCYEFGSVTTSVDAFTFTDSTMISGTDHTGAVLWFMEGAIFHEWAIVEDFDDVAGTFTLDRRMSAAPQVGQFYRVAAIGNVFNALSAADSVAGIVDYRCVFIKIDNGGQGLGNEARLFVEDLQPGSVQIDVAYGDKDSTNDILVTAIATATDEPILDGTSGQFTQSTKPQAFSHAVEYAPDGIIADSAPPNAVSNTPGTSRYQPVWLRRTVLPGASRTNLSIVRVTLGAAGQGVWDPVVPMSGLMVVSGVVGFVPSISLEADRSGYQWAEDVDPEDLWVRSRTLPVFGGSRVSLILTDVDTGAPVAGELATISLQSGPGSLVTPFPNETDADGKAFATYTAPNDEAEIGNDIVLAGKA